MECLIAIGVLLIGVLVLVAYIADAMTPRKPCSHCGRMLTQKETSRNYLCPTCGKPGPWATDSQVRAWNSHNLLHSQVVEILNRVPTDEAVDVLRHAVKQAESAAYLDSAGIQQTKQLAYEAFIRKYIADKVLTVRSTSSSKKRARC